MQHLNGNIVEFQKGIDAFDSYAEAGMRGRVIHIEEKYTDSSNTEDHIYVVTVDFSEFDEFNKQFESYNYYGPTPGSANVNARQAGFYSPQDKIYFPSPEEDPWERFIKIIDEKSEKLHQMFKESGETNYVKWLEDQIGV